MYGKMRFRSECKFKKLEELECLRTEYDSMYDYITQGAIIRSRELGTNWPAEITNIF